MRADLAEFLEHRVLILLRDADARVTHRHFRHAVPNGRAHGHATTLRRELERIGQKIQQHLLDLALVGADGADAIVDAARKLLVGRVDPPLRWAGVARGGAVTVTAPVAKPKAQPPKPAPKPAPDPDSELIRDSPF